MYCTHIIDDNIKFFLRHGYFSDEHTDFYICLNGDFDIDHYNKFIKDKNINNLFFIKRENTKLDFGAWSHTLFLKKDNKKLYENYDYFIFINSSCIGPFLPIYVKEKWTTLFINMLSNTVKLVGPTINHCHGRPHVQSYFLCTDKIGLDIALNNGIFDLMLLDEYNKNDESIYTKEIINEIIKEIIIDFHEIGFSKHILDSGYEIKSLLKGIENANISENLNNETLNFSYGHIGYDICGHNKYFGICFHPYEVIFYKSNRHIGDNTLIRYISFHNEIKNEYTDTFNDLFNQTIL